MRQRHRHLTAIAIALLLAAGLAACGGAGKSPDRSGQQALAGLDTVTVAAGDADGGRRWPGLVEAVRQATLSAQTGGRVAQVHVDVNDRVGAGQVLLRLEAVEQQAAADIARARLHAAEAAAVEAQASHRRYLELARAQHVAAAQLDQVKAALDAAIAARDAAHAELASARQQVTYTVIRAPYDGIVATRAVEPGESVAVGQLLMTVFAPEDLRIQVDIPQAAAAALRDDPRARVLLNDGRRIDVGHGVVFPAADPASHAVKVRIPLPELALPPSPGTTANVLFPALHDGGHPRIPATAVLRRGEITAAWVLDDDRLALRQLRLGRHVDGMVDVIAGLAPGEVVAADPVAARQALAAARREAR